MKYFIFFLATVFTISFLSCKSSSKATSSGENLEESLDEKNRQAISLLNRIRKLPGITLKGGTPIFSKGSNSLSSEGEPLYILNEYIIGNSFRSVDGIVESINVKKVEVLSQADASYYGSRAANGVIKIITYQ